MNARSIPLIHLVELVDQTHPPVCKHQRPPLQRPFLGHRVLVHPCCQAHSTSSLPRGVHCSRGYFFEVFEELTFGRARVTKQEHIDITADTVLVVDVFFDPGKEGEEEGELDLLVAVDGGGEGAEEGREGGREG